MERPGDAGSRGASRGGESRVAAGEIRAQEKVAGALVGQQKEFTAEFTETERAESGRDLGESGMSHSGMEYRQDEFTRVWAPRPGSGEGAVSLAPRSSPHAIDEALRVEPALAVAAYGPFEGVALGYLA